MISRMANTRKNNKNQEAAASGKVNTDEDEELNRLQQSLSPESLTLVRILVIILSKQFSTEINGLKSEIQKKDEVITELSDEVNALKSKVSDLELNLDDVAQYERRDTIILSGPALPNETPQENTTLVAINTIRDNLKINLKESEISVSHRLGASTVQRKRPLMIKLTNRSLKYDLVGACIKLKPQLYINESLTPKRLNILRQILGIRRAHKEKVQSVYTSEGKIIIRLKNSTLKHTIVDEKSLMAFLEKYPQMKDTYLAASAQ